MGGRRRAEKVGGWEEEAIYLSVSLWAPGSHHGKAIQNHTSVQTNHPGPFSTSNLESSPKKESKVAQGKDVRKRDGRNTCMGGGGGGCDGQVGGWVGDPGRGEQKQGKLV